MVDDRAAAELMTEAARTGTKQMQVRVAGLPGPDRAGALVLR